MTPNDQAARIVEEFERWITKLREWEYPETIKQSWVAGATSFAADAIANLYRAGDFGWVPYRDQIVTIRDRVLQPVEIVEHKTSAPARPS